MKFYFILSTLFILFSGCQKSGTTSSCAKDTDCKGDRICEKGTCIDPAKSETVTNPGFSSSKIIKKTTPKIPGFQIPPVNKNNIPFKMPKMPGLQLPKSFSNMFNMKLKLRSGKDDLTLQFKGIKKGVPVIEVCKNNKCQEMNSNKPGSLKKVMELLLGQKNNPMARMFRDLMKNFKPGHGSHGHSKGFPSVPYHSKPFAIKPPKARRTSPYRSWDEIITDGKQALGNEAILTNLKPVQITSTSVVFKTLKNNKIIATVSGTLSTSLPSLAKTSKRVTARILITLVSPKTIKGVLKEIDIPR